MTRVSLTHRITKIGGKAVSVAVCALTGLVLFGAAGSAFATPVVYFQTIAAGRSYFDSTVATYANGGTSDLLTTTVSGLAGGNSWSVGGIGISATNGVSRSIDDSYLSSAPSLSGTPTGQGINMTASGSDPEGSGLTFHFTSTLNAFGVEMGDWGTCCYPSALYIQFGLNGAWGAAQQIGVANSRTDVPEDNGQTFTFIGAVNDTNFFNDVRIYGAGNGDVLYAGGVLRTASVALNSVPSTSGSSTQAPSATDIDTGQASYLASNLGTSVNPAFVGGTLQIDSAGATIGSDFTVSNAGGTINANGYNSTFSGVISNAASSTGSMTFTGSGITALTNVNTYTGSTTINFGATLALSGSGSIAASSGVIDNGVFDISSTISGATIKTLSGNGAVFLGARTLTLSNAVGTFGGVVSGSGGLSVTGGSETLTGANTYTGSTTINFGATLALSGSGSIAASSGVIDNGVFDISSTISGATIKTLSGNGAVVLGTRTLTLSNAAGTFGGVVGGSGGLSVTGGSETLTGANTYTGATSVGSGATLTLSGPGSLASGTINIANDGTFNDSNGGLSASANVTDNGTLSLGANEAINQLDGSGAVGLGSHTLTLNQGSFGGVIGGTGGLVKAGAGTLTLSGTNTYSGGTTVNGGTVAVSSDANLGSAAGPLALNDGTLHTTASFTTARATSLTGTGTLTTDSGTALQDNGAVSGTGALSWTASAPCNCAAT
ncbi:MAG: autotransporter-associated beta strand repeat-containing protein [Zoogloea sp.]|nr:autotransporter-associated beta strand repeat-containing protein [Zoogloea sp.]